ncbi:MAG: alpha-L-glutamate ligase-like protein [Pirellulaceae bacterium]|nr:alpha-L-glutamate ligase-like protein [Pirellulaceae bacterium]
MKLSAWRFWAWPSELRRIGVLGMNSRNANYILRSNPRKYFPNVDDKLRTKKICESRHIPVPATFAAISRNGDIPKWLDFIRDRAEFVLKPAHGSGGRGIVVIASHDTETFTTAGGSNLSASDIRYHLSSILSGLFSLSGQPDTAIIEQRIVCHPAFQPFSFGGTPDIRVIVYRGFPVMAMVRLPTSISRGRANLHQGAIAAAVDLQTGTTFGGVCRNHPVDKHPDTGAIIQGFQVPFWNEILTASMDLADNLKLGYVGIDFVVDEQTGPLVLEANARPGLAIQVANRCGLAPRMERIDRQLTQQLSPTDRLAWLFAR